MTKTVAVVGAGVIGRLAAFYAARAGHDVTVFDSGPRDRPQGVSPVAAGMLAPYCERQSAEAEALFPGTDAVAAWADVLGPHATEAGLKQNGTWVLAPRGCGAQLRQFRRFLTKGGAAPTNKLDLHEVERQVPGLGESAAGGLAVSEEGHLDPEAGLYVLARRLQELGVGWRCNSLVTNVAPGSVTTTRSTESYSSVIDCRGLGARERFPDLRGVRGETLRIRAPEVDLPCPVRLLHPRHPLYLVPRGSGRYVVGATQLETEDASPTRLRSALELMSPLYQFHPGFHEAIIEAMPVGLRPAFSDNRPRLRWQPGLVEMNGFYRHGFLLGPAFAKAGVGALSGHIRAGETNDPARSFSCGKEVAP